MIKYALKISKSHTNKLKKVASYTALIGTICAAPVYADNHAFGDGITEQTVLQPFDANAQTCEAPTGLEKVLGFAQDNDREFMQGVDLGLKLAAENRGLEYRRALSSNDPARHVQNIDLFHASKVGAVVTAPMDPAAQSFSQIQLIKDGSYVGTIVAPPSTSLLNAPQYLTGKTLAEAAKTYIETELDGKANVVLLTHDQIEFLAPRYVAFRDVMATIPGVTIVADISPDPVNKEGGFETVSTLLQTQPKIDVVLGADTVVLGALAALESTGNARPDQFLGGIDGEPEAVSEIKKENSPYKASVALASPVFAYAMGQHAADWLEGKSIPMAMDILPIALTAQNLAQYEADIKDPAAVFTDASRRDQYLSMYGNICYSERAKFVNFPWSSEYKPGE